MHEDHCLPPVNAVSDSSSSGEDGGKAFPTGRGKKRKALAGDIEADVRSALGKPCGCQRNCFEHFRDKDGFAELLGLRAQWRSLHKLDQDRLAPGPGLHDYIFFRGVRKRVLTSIHLARFGTLRLRFLTGFGTVTTTVIPIGPFFQGRFASKRGRDFMGSASCL